MALITSLVSSALVVGVASSGFASTAPAPSAAPAVTVEVASATTAVAAPQIETFLLPVGPGSGSEPVYVLGKAEPGATVEVTYRGQTVTTTASPAGSDLAGLWSSELPGREFGGGERTVTATQIVDGVRSPETTHDYDGFVFPF